jgi:hypothetical protein
MPVPATRCSPPRALCLAPAQNFFSEANWRDATAKQPHFVITETPRYVGRAVAALVADPARARWSGQSLSSGQLAQVYGFTDLDGSQPDAWRYMREVQDDGKPADATGYR